ncbi:alcohol acyl transferase 1 allele RGa-like [Ziziphus jujuba]|uniref:Alcohol acyl transferase 1 allele RGa-like n=1 Tax=Ziziphus jujuba TaxID=326968 RepID=A0A6P4B5E4_ZIZJJ|nr:alcohol acyl transferase 1 allele RGa-like [Ziziphus jujuba]
METISPITNLTFKVKRCEPELIVPSKPTPHEVKKLSDVDNQKGLRVQIFAVWFFKKNDSPSMEGKDPVKVIREALGKALVYYYPLAGRLKEDSNGKLMVDCNAQGVCFIEADADVKLEQLGHTVIQPPFPYLQEVLYHVPGSDKVIDGPLWLIQVTRLRCGGFIVATRHNHTMVDAFGAGQFMNAVGEMARGAQHPSVLPVWHREILDAQKPPRVTRIHHEYQRDIDDAKLDIDMKNLAHLSFVFGPDQINAIRKHLPPHLATCSRFELITACIWKCRTLALNLDPKEVVQVTCAFNGRGKNFGLNLPLGYYGNAVFFLNAISMAGVLCKNPLGYALELLKKARSKMDEDHIRSVTNFIVTKNPPGYKIKRNFIISDLTKVGFAEVDLGWGCAEFAGNPGSYPMVTHYKHHKSNNVDYGIIVPICLPLLDMKRFKDELKKMIEGPITCETIQPAKILSML